MAKGKNTKKAKSKRAKRQPRTKSGKFKAK